MIERKNKMMDNYETSKRECMHKKDWINFGLTLICWGGFIFVLLGLIGDLFVGTVFGFVALLLLCPPMHWFVRRVILSKATLAMYVVLRMILILLAVFMIGFYVDEWKLNENMAQRYVMEYMQKKHSGENRYNFLSGYYEEKKELTKNGVLMLEATVTYSVHERGKEEEHSETFLFTFDKKTGEFSIAE